MKNILFIIGGLIGGGAEKALLSLLKNIDFSRYNVDLLLLTQGVDFPRDCPQKVHVKSFYGRWRILNRLFFFIQKKIGIAWHTIPWVVRRKIGHKHYDVIISYLEGAPVLIHQKILPFAKRNVSWIHSDFWCDHYTVPNYFKAEAEESVAYSKMDEIVAVSQNASLSFQKRYPDLRMPSVMYNVIDDSVRSKCLVRTKRKFTICTVGRLVPVKGFDRIIEVAKLFSDAGYDLDFWIIGKGKEYESLKKKIHEAELEDSVFLLGFHPNPSKQIACCDIFVSTSLAEGFSLVICEGMSQRLPIVATNTSGADELLCSGKFGILTEHTSEAIFQGLKRLVDDEPLRRHYSKLSEERIRDFETASLLKRFDEIVEG